MKIIKSVQNNSPVFLMSLAFYLAMGTVFAQNSELNQFHKFTGPISHDSIQFYISLPESYNRDTQHYPVIYYLHGMTEYFANLRTEQIIHFFRSQSRSGTLPEIILVFPDGKDGFWGDHYNGKTLLETNVVKEIIPYADQNFKTNNQRIIMGWSSGGGGALNFYTKYPDFFCGGISLDGAILNWQGMLFFQPEKTRKMTGSDSVYYYNHFCACHWITQNKESLLKSKKPTMLLFASFFKPYHQPFLSQLKSENIQVNYYELNCEHDFNCVFSQSQNKLVAFISGTLKIHVQKK
uniref:alpha/beta hydrolase n=1 Tax=uncultured Draconibacterium sp. TaxID=1573823 RepID=UPI0032165C67